MFNNTTIGAKTNIQVPVNMTMENLFKQYVNQVYGNTYKKFRIFMIRIKLQGMIREPLKKFLDQFHHLLF